MGRKSSHGLRVLGRIKRSWNDPFSYNLSREYPTSECKWFNNVVYFVFGILLSWFTIFNVATNGFELQPLYTVDPNSTLVTKYWFNALPFAWGDVKLQPTCQDIEIPFGYQFMTTNSGFYYTLNSVIYHSETPDQQRSSLPYLNNTLKNCQVTTIDIILNKADNSSPGNHYWWSWMESSADATAQCDVANAEGDFTIIFSANYATLATLYDYVVIDNSTTRASVWWGTRLLNNYFTGIQYVLSGNMPDSDKSTPAFTRVQLSYRPGQVNDIKNNNFYDIWFYFLDSDGSLVNQDYTANGDQLYNNHSFAWSRPLTEGFSFARVLQSLILVDLGNNAAPNFLLNPDMVQYALNATDDFNRFPGAPLNDGFGPESLDSWKYQGISPPGQLHIQSNSVQMNQAYGKFQNQMGPLGTKDTRIYAQYICSIPVRKGAATIFMLTLVADFVLLQAAWAIFKNLGVKWIEAGDPTAMYCEGCISQGHGLMHTDPTKESPSIPTRSKSVKSSSSSTQRLLHEDVPEDGNTFD